MPATAVAKKPPVNQDDPFAYVPEAQDYLRESVKGYGEQLQPDILKEIGSTLGDLNSIGGLRSGGAEVALGDIGQKYAGMIGAYAKQATSAGLDAGLRAKRQKFTEEEAKRTRKAAMARAVGAVLGAGIGFLASGGNPLGAKAGNQIGSELGGAAFDK